MSVIPGIVFDIQNSFRKYAETLDERLIESYTLEELEHIAPYYDDDDIDQPDYKLLEKRIKELKDKKDKKRTAREKWFERLISGSVGLIAGIILEMIRHYLFK